MSTLNEYAVRGARAAVPARRESSPTVLEKGLCVDEYAEFVTFNIYGPNGSQVSPNAIDDFGYVLTEFNRGQKIESPELLDLGSEDFTIRITFSLANYYGDDRLKLLQVIPLLHLAGPNITNPGSSPFCFGMTNPSNPDYVAKGDLFFNVIDDNGNSAYCFISATDWFMPPSGFAFPRTAEFTRKGQNFSLLYKDGFGERFISNNFPNFGRLAAPKGSTIYLFCGPDYECVESYFWGMQITKGIARSVGPHYTNTYNSSRRYPSQYPVKRIGENLVQDLQSLVMGLPVEFSAIGHAVVKLGTTTGLGFPFVANMYGEILTSVQVAGDGFKEITQSPAPFDFDSIPRYLDYDFGDASTLTMSGSRITAVADKSGNSRNATGVNTGPLIATGVINGLSATAPDTSGYLSLGTHLHELVALDEDFYIVLVYRPIYNSPDYKPVLHQQFVSGSGWLHFGIQDYYIDSNSVQSSLIYDGANWSAHTYEWKYCIYEVKPGDVKKTRRNGVEITSVSAGVIIDIPSGLNAYLGSDGASSDRKSFYGNIARFAIVKSSDLNVYGVEQYIWLKYGLPLPESHVYYNYLYAFDDSAETDAETIASGNVLANDVGRDIYVYKVNGSEANVGVTVDGSDGGMFTIAADGAWTFDPDSDFDSLTGTQTATTSVTYHVSDGVAEDDGTLTVTVSASAQPTVIFVGSSFATGGQSDFSIALPAGVLPGDLIIVVNACYGTSNKNPGVVTPGYTELCDLYSNSGVDGNLSISWKIAADPVDTSVIVYGSGSNSYGTIGIVHVWRGVDNLIPFDVATVTAIGIASANTDQNAASPSITPVTSGAVIVTAACLPGGNYDYSGWTCPSGVDNCVVAIDQAVGSVCGGMCSLAWFGGGAVSPGVWRGSLSSDSANRGWCAATMALRPAS